MVATKDAAKAADQSTIEMFQQDWNTYRKMIENNFLFHREAYAELHRVLRALPAPFSFLDIACGDASNSAQALRQTRVATYTGLDFSEHALALAAKNLVDIGCPVRLLQQDFLDAIEAWRDPVDVIWIGLSLHHLRAPDKLRFVRRIRSILGPTGRLLVFENTSRDGESRDSWLARWDLQRPLWHAYSDDEWSRMSAHVHAADFPEPVSGWRSIGRESGFRSVTDLYTTPTDLFRLWSFEA